MSEGENTTAWVAALERWLVREAVQKEIEPFLVGKQEIEQALKDESSLITKLFRLFLAFPPFKDEPEVEAALREIFSVLPVLDASLRLRGSSGLKMYLGPLLSGPVLSVARANRNEQVSEGLQRHAVDFAADLLLELNSQPYGLASFIEELKSAHSAAELRPSARRWFEHARDDAVKYFKRLQSDPMLHAKVSLFYSRIPKRALMLLLRSHAAASTSAATMRLMFSRPFGGMSVLQRIVADSLGYSTVCEEVDALSTRLSPDIKAILENFFKRDYAEWIARLIGEVDANGNRLSESEMLARTGRALIDIVMLESGGEYRLDEQQMKQAVRFVELMSTKESIAEILDLLANEELTNGISRLALAAQSKLAGSIFAKSSGMVKLAEDIFTCIERGLAMAGESEMTNLVERVLTRVLAVAHNVLVSDKAMVIHRTVEWGFSLYQNAASIALPTDELIDQLLLDDRTKVLTEAKRVYDRELAVAEFGSKKFPRPRLFVSEQLLLQQFIQCLSRLSLSPQLDVQDDMYPSLLRHDRFAAAQSHGLRHLDVTLDEQSWSHLSSRKFVLCGRTRSAILWARYKADVPPSIHMPAPIVEIVFLDTDSQPPSIEWTLVPKNVNKGFSLRGESKIFIWFRRARDEEESKFPIEGIEILPTATDERKKLALTQVGYRVIAAVKVGLMSESQVWVLGGLNQTETPVN